MASTTFIELVHWVISHGYFLFFVASFLEGPLVTAAAGVASALGYYNIGIIIVLSILGDLSADVVYYAIGYWGRKTLITRWGSYVGLTEDRIHSLGRMLNQNMGKAMIIIKLSPAIPVPGLIMIGSTHAPLKQFIKLSLLITLPKALLFALMGFFTGRAYEQFSNVITRSQYLLIGVALIVAVYIGYQKMTSRIAQGVGEK